MTLSTASASFIGLFAQSGSVLENCSGRGKRFGADQKGAPVLVAASSGKVFFRASPQTLIGPTSSNDRYCEGRSGQYTSVLVSQGGLEKHRNFLFEKGFLEVQASLVDIKPCIYIVEGIDHNTEILPEGIIENSLCLGAHPILQSFDVEMRKLTAKGTRSNNKNLCIFKFLLKLRPKD
ncbi:hypothetical protein STAS_10962 [Striga asiatica]|uniref:Uncharacterized protein n=1 Tax=Striga asiatica TaxID=4170 RepID=A0A5A7PPA9_STRAF|nr:hypothetical protein STAS_10962 [Striga asiatica]